MLKFNAFKIIQKFIVMKILSLTYIIVKCTRNGQLFSCFLLCQEKVIFSRSNTTLTIYLSYTSYIIVDFAPSLSIPTKFLTKCMRFSHGYESENLIAKSIDTDLRQIKLGLIKFDVNSTLNLNTKCLKNKFNVKCENIN